jgi:hypothetical protein
VLVLRWQVIRIGLAGWGCFLRWFLWLLLHCVTEQRARDSESLGMQMAIVALEKGAWFSDLYFTLLGKHFYLPRPSFCNGVQPQHLFSLAGCP